ncbi:hypothetical protein J437_LFUL000378 [Ladona fulva]|uniref:Methionyl-tRNA formyltransferase, mitochondrial n=1 Tax=Ladona fulva TaxID=123851 RepID=A0A8K0K4Y7_LADFU|nr:hypothetical protein J437_LFUL000378 [Ladona fulva]
MYKYSIDLPSINKLSLGHAASRFYRYFSAKCTFPVRVLFFGTDKFSLETLKKLNYGLRGGRILSRLDVVSSAKIKKSVISQYCDSNGLQMLHWPIKRQLEGYDIGVVASFGHLIPEDIIKSFPLGMLNVHASLLPRWRGAAPVIYAVMNGDEETGVSIMRIMPKKFDIGDVLAQSRVAIGPHDTANEVTDKLAICGADLLIDCLENLPESLENAKPQSKDGITYAPKVKPSLAVIKWSETETKKAYNLWRALYGTLHLITFWHGLQVKLIEACNCSFNSSSSSIQPGKVEYLKKQKIILVTCADGGKIGFQKIAIAGKKIMSAEDFYNGYMSKRNDSEWIFV